MGDLGTLVEVYRYTTHPLTKFYLKNVINWASSIHFCHHQDSTETQILKVLEVKSEPTVNGGHW